jgi:hypothetical protein
MVSIPVAVGLLNVALAPVLAGGTLVAMVPSKAGLVVAADSRASVAKRYCDNAFKIVELKKPARTIITVTGEGIFVPPPGPAVSDLCEYVKTTPGLLDIEDIVRTYLQTANREIAKVRTEDVGQQYTTAVRQFRASFPGALRRYVAREMFSVVMAGYDPKRKTATVVSFVVRIAAVTLDPEVTKIRRTETRPETPREVLAFGETDYLNQHVYGGAGRQFLSKETIAFILAEKTVRETTLPEALAVAVDVVEATSRTTDLIPAPSGIGGPIDVVLLGR